MPHTDLLRQLEGFSLTTAEILYRLPDHPRLLQSYVWQDYDLAPKFPKLVDFLDYWATNLDGPLYRVRVANCPICLTMAHGHALCRSHADSRCSSR